MWKRLIPTKLPLSVPPSVMNCRPSHAWSSRSRSWSQDRRTCGRPDAVASGIVTTFRGTQAAVLTRHRARVRRRNENRIDQNQLESPVLATHFFTLASPLASPLINLMS
ncbi:hypothetical protein Ae201684_017979 [Aphanomyces euteiches]|uniref:Uncharacterized protein n=1 Tax=Aphanomyces euteiches TaxID=100861 RepID=A0A6G0W9Z5_9STRA|nr:hypothetical protein Ae201684_017979 [Aphanomyces euteiches]